MKFIDRIKSIYNHGDVAFYFSLLGPLLMGTLHLIVTILHFNWIFLNYCIFSYTVVLFKVWQWAIEKYRIKPNCYIAGVISLVFIIAPMMASIVMTIRYKDAPHYVFDWLVYAYATYATIKIVFAIRSMFKKNKNDRQYILSYLGMITSLYTVQMMEFALIMTFSSGRSDNSMYLMQLFTQGAIFLFALFVIFLFIRKYVNSKKYPTNYDI